MMHTEVTLKSAQLWQILESTARDLKAISLQTLFQEDPTRAQKFSLTLGDIYLDYSKNHITPGVLTQLLQLAKTHNVEQAIDHLFNGVAINVSEKRPALHTALRTDQTSLVVQGEDILVPIRREKEKMARIVQCLQQGEWLGATGKPITAVVNIGIGGSDLGPCMAVEALKGYQNSALNIHFLSNIDPSAFTELTAHLNPATTLFIVSSKSFATPETLTNAQVAKHWLSQNLGSVALTAHFIAVTANVEKALAFGVANKNILTFGSWVGGRYSVWSPIGLPLALSIGMSHFEEFLQGANAMDQHFASAPLAQNMPVILALVGIWYINFWHASTLAILPYSQGLRLLPAYLQQLDMESNGKSVQLGGATVQYDTAPIVWGQAGTNGQHAFYQLLHQGTHCVPIDFIVAAQSNTSLTAQHRELVANCLAQAQALMQGSTLVGQMPGNKPSNMILLNKMTPYALGQLLALYEHKVYVQGVIWQINSFDQPGVELGKILANQVLGSLESGKLAQDTDASTATLIEKIRCLN